MRPSAAASSTASRPARSALTGEIAFFLLHLLQIALGVYVGGIGVGWPFVEKTFGLGLDALGVYLAAGMAARLFGSFFGGKVMAAFGVRTQIVGGVAFLSIGLLGHGLVQTWPLLLICSFLVGLGDSAWATGISAYAVAKRSPRQLSVLFGIFGVGLMVGPQVVTLVVRDWGLPWQAVYLALGGITIGLGLLVALTSTSWTIQPVHVEGQTPIRPASMRQTLSLPLMWMTMAVFFTYAGAEVTAGQYANALYTEGRGVDPRTVSGWITLFWAAFTAGRLGLGAVIERLGKTRTVRLLSLGMVLAAGIMWLWRDPAFGYVGLTLMGLSMSAVFPTLVTQVGDRFEVRHTANAIGFQVSAAALGSAILPGIAGALATSISVEVIPPLVLLQCVAQVILHERLVTMTASHAPAPPPTLPTARS
jgi:fucose permease